MKNSFEYSILQYRHSLVSGEAINVGVLFSFPYDKKKFFITGNTKRVKCAYPDFDTKVFNRVTKDIAKKIEEINSNLSGSLFSHKNSSLKEFISREILQAGSTSLQFSEPFSGVNDINNSKQIVIEFTSILLPHLDEIQIEAKYDEAHIIRNFSNRLVNKVDKAKLDTYLRHDFEVNTRAASLKFEIAWPNKKYLHLVKPISFDVIEASTIKDKAARFWGYLGLLNNYAVANNYYFDLLVASPRNPALIEFYNDAIETLKSVNSPKKIITEDALEEYSDEAAYNLSKDRL